MWPECMSTADQNIQGARLHPAACISCCFSQHRIARPPAPLTAPHLPDHRSSAPLLHRLCSSPRYTPPCGPSPAPGCPTRQLCAEGVTFLTRTAVAEGDIQCTQAMWGLHPQRPPRAPLGLPQACAVLHTADTAGLASVDHAAVAAGLAGWQERHCSLPGYLNASRSMGGPRPSCRFCTA